MTGLKSECGEYVLGERLEEGSFSYRIYRADGSYWGTTTYWSNLMTSDRIRFEVGNSALDFKAIFSYQRYPRWFHRRWVAIWHIDIEQLAKLVEDCGGKVLVGYKPGMSAWNHIGFRGSNQCARAVDAELIWQGHEFHRRNGKKSFGGWDIECPEKERIKTNG